jgi:hypothetical protein
VGGRDVLASGSAFTAVLRCRFLRSQLVLMTGVHPDVTTQRTRACASSRTHLEVRMLMRDTGTTRLQDQRRSRVNEKLVTALRVGRLADAAVNLLEVDDVCDHGLELAAVLSARAR